MICLRLAGADLDCLCLYGNSDGTWEVAPPPEMVPPELPEPALGINFSRDTMYRSDWVALLSVFSDSWLLAVAFFHGARLDRDDRYTAPDSSLLSRSHTMLLPLLI